MNPVRLVSVFTVATLVSGTSAGEQERPTGIDPECIRFIREVCMPQWKQAADVQRNIEVDCEETYSSVWVAENGAPQSKEYVMKWTFSWNADLQVCLARVGFESGNQAIPGMVSDCVYNQHYRFVASKTKPTDRFLLSEAIRRKPEEEWALSEEGFNRRCLQRIGYGHRPFGVSLMEFVEHPDFKLIKAVFLQNASPELVAGSLPQRSIYIESRCVTSDRPYDNEGAVYQVTLHAENDWLVSHAELHQRQEPEEMWLDIDYEDRQYEGLSFPRRITYGLKQARLDNRVHWSYVFSRPRRSERKPEEFLITAYGLPEDVLPPLPGTSARRPNAMFLINLGVIGILLSIWLGRWAVRLRQSRQKPPEHQQNPAAGA